MFTIVFLSFHSEDHIRRLVSGIEKDYPIIVVENSLNLPKSRSFSDTLLDIKSRHT